MRALVPAAIVAAAFAAGALAQSQATRKPAPDDVAATTYEHLATAIIELNATEDHLVKGILIHHDHRARHHLEAAARDAANRNGHLEEAAAEIANIANEGDKRVQAIRQRLSKAGHTHNTDTQTKEDYMFIDSKEKKQLLALAKRVGSLGDKASEADIRGAQEELAAIFDKAIASE